MAGRTSFASNAKLTAQAIVGSLIVAAPLLAMFSWLHSPWWLTTAMIVFLIPVLQKRIDRLLAKVESCLDDSVTDVTTRSDP